MTISSRRRQASSGLSVKHPSKKLSKILFFPVRLSGSGRVWADAKVIRAEPRTLRDWGWPFAEATYGRRAGAKNPRSVFPLKAAASEYLERGWNLMRLPPRSKNPYKGKGQSFAKNIIDWKSIDTLTENNLAIVFTRAGELKDLDLDYQTAADLARELDLAKSTATFGRPGRHWALPVQCGRMRGEGIQPAGAEQAQQIPARTATT
jgi:hypothetical protein